MGDRRRPAADTRQRFAEQIPNFALPAAYSVARMDGAGLTFGHVNALGAVRPLPAVVLASVCGYVATTAVYRLEHQQLVEAIELLAPAEAATHMPHPNLWSWRELAVRGADSSFLAFFVARAEDPPVNEHDARFRRLITR